MPPIPVVHDVQTTRIIIDIPPRARDGAMAPVVTVTRTTVLINDETGEVVTTTSADTRVLSNVTEDPGFPAIYQGLKNAIDPVFAPAPEPTPEPDPTPDPVVEDQP